MGLWSKLTRMSEDRILRRKRRLHFESRENVNLTALLLVLRSRVSALGLTLDLFSVSCS